MSRLVLLSQPAVAAPDALPLGAASVAAALRAAYGTRLELLLLEGSAPGAKAEGRAALGGGGAADPEDRAASELAGRALAARPDWVGLSLYSWNRRLLLAVARELRARKPDLVVFAGGPEATAEPEEVLAEGGLDFVLAGEGESAAVAAIGVLLAGQKLSRNLRRAPAEEAGSLASPWLAGILDPRRTGAALWELARGCPFRCAYCYESKGEPGVRPFPRERIEAELELFARAAPLEIFVLDPTFNADRERAASLLELFARRGKGLRWHFEVRAEFLDRRLAKAFGRLDCSLQVGLQSSDPAVLSGVDRPGFDPGLFASRLRLLDEAGVAFGLDLIWGLPGDSLAGFARSLDFALALGPNHLDLFPLAVLPGTSLADRAAELGLEVEAGAPHLLLSAPGWPAADLAAAARLSRGAALFYTRGRAVPWFGRAMAALRLRPSAFLARFGELLARAEAGEVEGALAALAAAGASPPQRLVEEAQLEFTAAECAARKRGHLAETMCDIIRLEGALSRAFAEGEATTLELSRDAELLAGPAALDVAAFAARFPRAPGRWRVAPGRDGPRIERLGGGSGGARGSASGSGSRGLRPRS